MHPSHAEDPADVVVAWEAVEDLLAVVPEGMGKDVLRMTAAGWSAHEIAGRLGLTVDDVRVHAARARIRVLTDAAAHAELAGGSDDH